MQFSASQINEKFEHKLTQKVTNRLESVYNQRPIRCEEMASVLLGLFDNDNYNCVFENGKLYKNVGYVKKHKV
uniref:Uncharacterized protein n=1 Tax=Caenorhabditis japonica TaxID=281687 RepID=A0A8R1ITW4_CAEJA